MKGLLGILMGLLFVVGGARAEVVAPDALISAVVQDVLKIVKQDKDIQAGNQKKILELVDAKVLPHFDFSRMTQLAVGKHWRAATPEQKTVLVAQFRDLLVRTYAKALSEYRNQTIEVLPFKMAADATEAKVRTAINKPGGQSISVDYEMRKRDEGWKAFDIVIGGVSMVMSYRGTFDAEVGQNGIAGLIKVLSDKNASAANLALHKEGSK